MTHYLHSHSNGSLVTLSQPNCKGSWEIKFCVPKKEGVCEHRSLSLPKSLKFFLLYIYLSVSLCLLYGCEDLFHSFLKHRFSHNFPRQILCLYLQDAFSFPSSTEYKTLFLTHLCKKIHSESALLTVWVFILF